MRDGKPINALLKYISALMLPVYFRVIREHNLYAREYEDSVESRANYKAIWISYIFCSIQPRQKENIVNVKAVTYKSFHNTELYRIVQNFSQYRLES